LRVLCGVVVCFFLPAQVNRTLELLHLDTAGGEAGLKSLVDALKVRDCKHCASFSVLFSC
jgi:hypothetical protein